MDGEAWMVDGEALVMMMATISSKSPSRQGARTEFLTPGRGFAMAAEFRKGFVKNDYSPDVFRSRGLSSREGGRGGCPSILHHVVAWPWAHRAATWRGPPFAPLRLIFWLRESSGKIGTLQLFPKFFLNVDFLHKNETPGQFC